MKKFKEFLREEDAMASTNKTGEQGYKSTSFSGKSEFIPPAELPPGHPDSHQHGPPSPYKPPKPRPFPHGPEPISPGDELFDFGRWEDYLRFLYEWFIWQAKLGQFNVWSQEQIDQWWADLLERQKEKFDRYQRELEENPPFDFGDQIA